MPENKKSISEVTAAIVDVVTGRDISKLHEKAKGIDLFESIRKEEDIQELVIKIIDDLIEERANQLVIFIDELDRCKPEYAIRLLERIKHYFNDDRVIFVFSVNLSQLQHTVKNYYGSDFDAGRYLDKFFDLRISLPEINYDTYLRNRFDFINSSYIYDKVCVEVIKHFRLSFRETERFIRLIKIAGYKQTRSATTTGFSDGLAYNFALMYIVPIMIGLSMTNMEKYVHFITGVDSSPLFEILSSSELRLHQDTRYLLSPNECFSEQEKTNKGDIVVSMEKRINEVYEALFSNLFNQGYRERNIGKMEFSLRTREEISKIVSLLSPVAIYDFE